MNNDRNLLFGVLALQADLIDERQFVEICAAWAARKDVPLAALLVERGWLQPMDVQDVERLLDRKLKKHAGDVGASLAEVADDDVRRALAVLDDPAIHESFAKLPQHAGRVLLTSITGPSGARERYQLTTLHARGGIGQVWRARDPQLHREIALKELRPDRSGQALLTHRFIAEAQITGQLEHPGIVPVYELISPENGTPFYTMRFIQGRTLVDAVRSYHARRQAGHATALEQRDLLNVFVKVCHAVAYAHSRGVIHRDLKGQNIVLGDFGEVIVLDWGLAKVIGAPEQSSESTLASAPAALPAPPVVLEASDDETLPGQVLGTPAYMAPEQAAGRLDLVGFRTDVYGLGAILYEILTGRAPFRGETKEETLRLVRDEAPAPPRALAPTPAPLEAICLKALRKQPAERYASAQELARDVEAWLADEPIKAYVDPPLARLARWGRQHRTGVAAAAVLLLTAVVALSISTVLISREQEQTERALQAAHDADRQRVRAEIDALLGADDASVPALLANLQRASADSLPLLRQRAERDDLTERQQVRLRLALLPHDDGQLPHLRERLLTAPLAELRALRGALLPYRDQLDSDLWKALAASDTPAASRLRAAATLALLDPEAARWPNHAASVALDLVSQDVLTLGEWLELLRPVQTALLSPLRRVYAEATTAERREAAALALAEYANDRVAELVRLLTEAEPRSYAALLAAVRKQPQASRLLEQVLADTAKAGWDDAFVAKPVDAICRGQIEAAKGMVTPHFAFVQTLPLSDFEPLSKALTAFGYRPVRCRPYVADNQVLTAGLWHGDGVAWQAALDVPLEELNRTSSAHQEQGWLPVDVAGYVHNGKEAYVALWSRSRPGVKTARLYVGKIHEQELSPEDTLRQWDLLAERQQLQDGLFLFDTLQIMRGGDGKHRFNFIFAQPDVAKHSNWSTLLPQVQFERWLNPSQLHTDIALLPSERAAKPTPLYEPLVKLVENHAAGVFGADLKLLRAGCTKTAAGQDEAAVEVLTTLIEKVDRQRTGPLSKFEFMPVRYGIRALALARVGRVMEARDDLQRLQDAVVKFNATLDQARKLNLDNNVFENLRPQREWCSYFSCCASAYIDPQAAQHELQRFVAAARMDDHADALYLAARAYAVAAEALSATVAVKDQKAPKDAQAARAKLRSQFLARSLQTLQDAVDRGFGARAQLLGCTDLDPLRDRAEFTELLSRAELDCYYMATAQTTLAERPFRSHECIGLTVDEHLERCRALAAAGLRPVSLGVAWIESDRPARAASIWHEPLPSNRARDALARRQAAAAMALLSLPGPDPWDDWLRLTPDPRHRTYLVNLLARQPDMVPLLAEQLDILKGVSAQRAVLIALGDAEAADTLRRKLAPGLLNRYREHPDAGIHGTVGWLLRRWGFAEQLRKVDAAAERTVPAHDKDWYVNLQGQTLTVIRKPEPYLRGSPGHEEHRGMEPLHEVLIPRAFAIGCTEVTRAQYLRFDSDLPAIAVTRDLDAPATNITWYQALQYCRWLSEQEGVPEEEMCVPPIAFIGPGMKLPANYLERTGYRLPTEAEWEYACRAGTTTSRYYGDDPELLDRYAWTIRQSQTMTHPVALLRPNDLGLFDMLGNANEWCMDTLRAYPRAPLKATWIDAGVDDGSGVLVVRGGGFEAPPHQVRAALRNFGKADARDYRLGFRIARTVRKLTE